VGNGLVAITHLRDTDISSSSQLIIWGEAGQNLVPGLNQGTLAT
jgi:hypothetical protein